jgi:hypothetical protein
MTMELSISGINNLSSLLERLPLGEQARAVAQRIAVWTTPAHQQVAGSRQKFPTNFADLNEDKLSDTYAYWNSELIRIHELHGLLDGQRKYLELQAKKEKALARGAVRKEFEELAAAAKEKGEKVNKPTAAEINDRAEENEKVLAVDEVQAMLDMVMASVSGYREACVTATTGLSREISFRQAQFQARLR